MSKLLRPVVLIPTLIGAVPVGVLVAGLVFPGSHVLTVAVAAMVTVALTTVLAVYAVVKGHGPLLARLVGAVEDLVEAAGQIVALLPDASRFAALEGELEAVAARLARVEIELGGATPVANNSNN